MSRTLENRSVTEMDVFAGSTRMANRDTIGTYGMSRTRILLADDHNMVAAGLQAFLHETFELLGVVHDGRALVEAADRLKPDVIVTDISMPLMNGLDAVRQIRMKRADAKIVILTMHRDTHLAVDALRAGCSGYLLKVSPGEELVTAIREVALGRVYVTTLLSRDLITLLMEANNENHRNKPALTSRQREVLQLIAEGRTMKEVASILNISPARPSLTNTKSCIFWAFKIRPN